MTTPETVPESVPDTVTVRRTPRWVKVVLFLSLALNLAVVGAVGAMGMRHGKSMHGGAYGGPLTRALDAEDRRAIGQGLRAQFPRRDARAARDWAAQNDALLTALRAVPFDPAPVARLLDERQDRIGARLDLGQRLLLERLTAMPDARRAAYADRLAEKFARWSHRKGATDGDR